LTQENGNPVRLSEVVPTPDGRSLEPYRDSALTVKGEFEKLAFNIAMGRNFAGTHYRSDASTSIRLRKSPSQFWKTW
jgi:hypothetical protein